VRDYRHAITWAQARPEVDAGRIGVWGPSYSGGHVLVLGAIDKRIKCVVAQVPLVSGFRNIQRLVRQDFMAPNRALFESDRAARYRGEPPAMIPVVDPDPMATSALPTPDSWEWFGETGKIRAPSWKEVGLPITGRPGANRIVWMIKGLPTSSDGRMIETYRCWRSVGTRGRCWATGTLSGMTGWCSWWAAYQSA
jgi:Acetyl xylan esterase (AXE1)